MGLREQRRAALRDQILEVCGRLFREQGYDDTTVADIARATGISRQTFFNHFTGKDAVLAQLGVAWLREQAAVPRLGAGARRDTGILAGARRAVLAQMRAIEADADFMRVVFTRSGVLFPQPAASGGRAGADQARSLFDNLALVMRAGQDAGEIRRDIDALQAAELYVSTMLMTARLWLVDFWGDGGSLEARASRALDVLEAGLAPAAAGHHSGAGSQDDGRAANHED